MARAARIMQIPASRGLSTYIIAPSAQPLNNASTTRTGFFRVLIGIRLHAQHCTVLMSDSLQLPADEPGTVPVAVLQVNANLLLWRSVMAFVRTNHTTIYP